MYEDANCETETKIRKQTSMAEESESQNTGRENKMNPKNGQPESKKQNEKITKAIDGLRPTRQPFSLTARAGTPTTFSVLGNTLAPGGTITGTTAFVLTNASGKVSVAGYYDSGLSSANPISKIL